MHSEPNHIDFISNWVKLMNAWSGSTMFLQPPTLFSLPVLLTVARFKRDLINICSCKYALQCRLFHFPSFSFSLHVYVPHSDKTTFQRSSINYWKINFYQGRRTCVCWLYEVFIIPRGKKICFYITWWQGITDTPHPFSSHQTYNHKTTIEKNTESLLLDLLTRSIEFWDDCHSYKHKH